MSRADIFKPLTSFGSPVVCEFCGMEIEVAGQDCPALDDGGCRP